MINLLPPEQQKILTIKKYSNVAVILGTLGTVAVICIILILLSLVFYAQEALRYQRQVTASLAQISRPENVHRSEMIAAYNTSLTAVNDFYKKEIFMSQILDSLTQIPRPPGLFFADIDMQKDGKQVTVKITGASDTRDSLLTYKKNLEAVFPQAVFPPENWVRATKVDFRITIPFTRL